MLVKLPWDKSCYLTVIQYCNLNNSSSYMYFWPNFQDMSSTRRGTSLPSFVNFWASSFFVYFCTFRLFWTKWALATPCTLTKDHLSLPQIIWADLDQNWPSFYWFKLNYKIKTNMHICVYNVHALCSVQIFCIFCLDSVSLKKL